MFDLQGCASKLGPFARAQADAGDIAHPAGGATLAALAEVKVLEFVEHELQDFSWKSGKGLVGSRPRPVLFEWCGTLEKVFRSPGD